jgi:hypothetical protein
VGAKRQPPLLAKRANSAGVAVHERGSKLSSSISDTVITTLYHQAARGDGERPAIRPGQLHRLAWPAVHPIEKTLARTHPHLGVLALIVDHSEVDVQNCVRARLDPLAQHIRQARLRLVQPAASPSRRGDVGTIRVMR